LEGKCPKKPYYKKGEGQVPEVKKKIHQSESRRTEGMTQTCPAWGRKKGVPKGRETATFKIWKERILSLPV